MKFVYFLLARVLPTTSVDAAVKALTKAAAKLAAAEDVQINRASSLQSQIDQLSNDRAEAIGAAARARRIADKLADLTA